MKPALVALLLLATPALAAPETVAITYRFAPANEPALRKVIEQHWATLTRLGLVVGAHELYRGEGFFLEIFTWKDDSIPDNAPAEVLAHWKKMNALVQGKDGMRIEAVDRIDLKR